MNVNTQIKRELFSQILGLLTIIKIWNTTKSSYIHHCHLHFMSTNNDVVFGILIKVRRSKI